MAPRRLTLCLAQFALAMALPALAMATTATPAIGFEPAPLSCSPAAPTKMFLEAPAGLDSGRPSVEGQLPLLLPPAHPTCSGDDCGCYSPPCQEQCAGQPCCQCLMECAQAARQCARACCGGF